MSDLAARPEVAALELRPAAAPPAAERIGSAAPALAALVLGGLILRALTSILLPNVAWADEIFQAPEQALRLLTGRGLVPWEYQIGARSWILPGLVMPLMAAGRALSADPRVALGLITALMTALSAVNTVSAYVIGARAGRRVHGLFAAGLAAGWSELVYYSPHLLPDTVSGALLLAAMAVATRPESRTRLFWCGLLLGAALAVRVQLAPAIAFVGLATCGREVRTRLLPLAAGFAVPVAAYGALDWLTWGAPFRSLWVYVLSNTSGIADGFGADAPLTYVWLEKVSWGPATVLIVTTAFLGAKRARGLALTAAVVLLTFSAVPHKEARFIYPALLMLFVLCGVGTVELGEDVGRRLPGERARRLVLPAMAVLWATASLAVGFGTPMRALWTRKATVLQALNVVNGDRASCGLALDPPKWPLAGLSQLRDDLALYNAWTAPPAAYNAVLIFSRRPHRPVADYTARGFALRACYYGQEQVCLYSRPGRCAGGTPMRAETPAFVLGALRRQGFSVY